MKKLLLISSAFLFSIFITLSVANPIADAEGLQEPTGSTIQVLSKPTLKQRQESGMKVVGGSFTPYKNGYVAGTLGDLMHRGDNIEITGTGYLRIRTELEFWYGIGKISMPEISAQTKDTKVQSVGEGYQYFSESSYNQSDDTPGIGYNDRFIWFSGTIKIGELEKISGYNAQYNIGVSDVSFNQVNNGTAVVYDTSDGILPAYSYKLISRGTGNDGYMDDQLVETRDRQFDTTGKYDSTTADNGATAQNVVYRGEDEETANQWWTFIYAGDQDGNHYYRILNDLTGKYLSVANNNAGYNVITEDENASSQSQLWAINKADNETNPDLSNHSSTAMYDTFQNKASGLYLTDDGSSLSQQPLGKVGTALFMPRYTKGYTDHDGDGLPDSLLSAFRLDSTKYKRYEAESLDSSKYAAQGTDAERNWRGNEDVSGTRFVRLSQTNPTLTETVNVPQTGPYDVLIHYGSNSDVSSPVYVKAQLADGKEYYVANDGKTSAVSGDNLDDNLAQQTLVFTNNSSYPSGAHNSTSHKFLLWFSDGSIKQTQLYLHAGKNEVTVTDPSGSTLDLDYLDVALKSSDPVTDTNTGTGTSSTTSTAVPNNTDPTQTTNSNSSSNSADGTTGSEPVTTSQSSSSRSTTKKASVSKKSKFSAFMGYAKHLIYEYNSTTFSKKGRKIKVLKHASFKVIGVKKSASGLNRYKLSNGRYITSNDKFVDKLYLTKKKNKAKVINKHGLYEYKKIAFSKGNRVRYLHKGTDIAVKKIVHFKLTTRLQLTNGHYVTGSKLFVKNIQ
ncbi:DUF5776 domain-containing protein [Lentilactobacillus hilgardii]|nr:DUF5776 domain-containing protein [Lentilactobacillus hilgardii]MCV3741540.1 DUF5776 domain-containing protein [Lentilactobacillus hilgardii]